MSRSSKALRWALVVALLVLLPSGAWYAGRRAERSSHADARAAAPAPTRLTEPVVARPLARTLAFRAEVGSQQEFGVPVPVVDGSEPIVTRVRPQEAGPQLKSGDFVLEVAGRPVLVLVGQFPAYRDLKLGDHGPDVAQLERALAQAGLKPGRIDGTYDQSTAHAVGTLWTRAGYAPQTTPAPPPPSPPAVEGQPAPPPPPPLPPVPMVGRQEVVYVSSTPVVVTAGPPPVGAKVEGTPMRLGATQLRATAKIPKAQVAEAKPGTAVTLIDEASGATLEGKLGVVPAQIAVSDARTVDASVHEVNLPPEWNGKNLLAKSVLQASNGPVKVVPVSAVVPRADGSAQVRVVLPSGEERTVSVQPGLSADGYVAIEGDVQAGDQVRVS